MLVPDGAKECTSLNAEGKRRRTKATNIENPVNSLETCKKLQSQQFQIGLSYSCKVAGPEIVFPAGAAVDTSSQ